MTNRENTKKILGETLDKTLFEYNGGLRNILLHGKVKDHTQFEGLSEELYSKIRSYMKAEYEIELEENVVHPQRSFYGNFEVMRNFWVFNADPIIDVKIIEEALDDRTGKNQKEQELLSLVENFENH